MVVSCLISDINLLILIIHFRIKWWRWYCKFSAQKLTPSLFHSNFGAFQLDNIADVGVNPSRNLKLISRDIIFEVFQSMWKTTWTLQTDRRTVAWPRSCIASRGKRDKSRMVHATFWLGIEQRQNLHGMQQRSSVPDLHDTLTRNRRQIHVNAVDLYGAGF